MTSFYRGGPYVANTGANANVPTSGPISMLNFLGATRVGPLSAGSSNVSGSTMVGQANDLVGNSTINASGGAAPYTYSTAHLSGTSFGLANATTRFPEFRRSGNPPAGAVSGIYRCTVTDNVGTQAFTNFTVTDNRT